MTSLPTHIVVSIKDERIHGTDSNGKLLDLNTAARLCDSLNAAVAHHSQSHVVMSCTFMTEDETHFPNSTEFKPNYVDPFSAPCTHLGPHELICTT
ncbi:hypothetical protein [Tessaracoccus sp.]